MLLSKAISLFNELKDILDPYCLRIEVAGSVRRGKPFPNDIELVVIPDKWKLEQFFKLFNMWHYDEDFEILKNGPKYKQFYYKSEKIDLFIAEKSNFGLIYLIRTGSAYFSAMTLTKWKHVSKGGYSMNGYLHTAEDIKVTTYEERDVFKLCEMTFINPKNRSI